jgi:hypothetical protein
LSLPGNLAGGKFFARWRSAAGLLDDLLREVNRGGSAPAPTPSSPSAGSSASAVASCRVESASFGPASSNVTYRYWIEQVTRSTTGTQSFKILRLIDVGEAPPSGGGRTVHGPYATAEEAQRDLDNRLCPRSRR